MTYLFLLLSYSFFRTSKGIFNFTINFNHTQERWLRGNPEHCNLLRALPIFLAAEASAATAAQPLHFMRLPATALMAPADMPCDALPDAFVAAGSDNERNALKHLGAKALTRCAVFR